MTTQLLPGQHSGTAINDASAPRWYGLYPAVVSDNQDPDQQGRVKVRLPWTPDGSSAYDAWARVATTMAGGDRGTWFVPEVDDEVLIGFGGGNPDHPYVVGALWNGVDSPPQSMDTDNNVKAIVSREDIRITLDDTAGAVTLKLETPGGQSITLADRGSTITFEDSNGNSLELAPGNITLTAATKLTISAASIDINAPMVNVDSAMWKYTGVIQNDTLITNSVVSLAYTPGAGNVW
ncbi:MAG: phage baseplate assembly protein V [Marmoricola sp.]